VVIIIISLHCSTMYYVQYYVARWKHRMQKFVVCAPLHNFVSYIFVTKACIDNWKKTVKQQYLFNMSSQYG